MINDVAGSFRPMTSVPFVTNTGDVLIVKNIADPNLLRDDIAIV